MSLSDAMAADGTPVELPGKSPFSCKELAPLYRSPFRIQPLDSRLSAIHDGGGASSAPLDNLVGLVSAWESEEAWLDFLNPDAPNHQASLLERDLYLQHWNSYLPAQGRVLDLGGGIGRFATVLLDRGLDVELVDPDLRSLWRAVWHAHGRTGRLDVHWATGEHLPSLEPVDAVLATELLCYAEDPERILENVKSVLAPGAPLLLSVEARWGWAMSLDVLPSTLDALLVDGVVHVPGDRWIRTYEEEDLRILLKDWEIEWIRPSHYVPSGPFEASAGEMDLEKVMAWENALTANPRTTHLNRAWMAVARWPTDR